ncbi:hypothetical protein [Hyalangium sp.]|uniref:hypothetical protein n=1 Tax=Hyalangium sp. TaxID=2028555 RepID=UPI00389B16AB
MPLALLLLRSGRSEGLAVLLETWKPLLAEVLAAPGGEEHLRAIVHYLLLVGVKAARESLRRVINSVAGEQRAKELMKTMGEELIEQGMAKGLAQGLARGRALERAEGVLRILAARGVTVDDKARELILSCSDLATLERWFDRALTAIRFADLLVND